MPEVVVIDTGIGNLGNVVRAFERVGASPVITAEPSRVAGARCLVLPGVGAFRPPRERLRGELEEALRRAVDDGAWLLGICVGYQLLFDTSEEFGQTDGLGLVPGRVVELPDTVSRPHIGWNRIRHVGDHPILAGLDDGSTVYYVHSYAPADVPLEHRLATSLHGVEFTAMAAADRVIGAQFHPERSGEIGLRLLRNFKELAA